MDMFNGSKCLNSLIFQSDILLEKRTIKLGFSGELNKSNYG